MAQIIKHKFDKNQDIILTKVNNSGVYTAVFRSELENTKSIESQNNNFFDANIELTSKDFDKIYPYKLLNKNVTIVLFYAPWCGYCQDTKEIWRQLLHEFDNIKAFNCEGGSTKGTTQITNNSHLMRIKEQMPGMIPFFPTIQVFINGEPGEVYDGDRSVNALRNWILSFSTGNTIKSKHSKRK